jgi:hypothetical protein
MVKKEMPLAPPELTAVIMTRRYRSCARPGCVEVSKELSRLPILTAFVHLGRDQWL